MQNKTTIIYTPLSPAHCGKSRRSRTTRRLLLIVLAVAMLAAVCLLSGCTKDDWTGEWHRTGDATFARADMDIYDVTPRGFYFSMTLYNGNVVGRLDNYHAAFTDRACTTAQYSIPETRAYITFTLNDKGHIDVIFYDDSALFVETEAMPYSTSEMTQADYFQFDAIAFVDGNYTRDAVDYLNYDLCSAGVLSAEDNAKVQALMPSDLFIRCLDCFQNWTADGHDDEIGGFVYYGSNTVQQYAAVIITYDDGTVSVVISKTDGSLVYYSDNHIYGTGEIMPLPIKKWMEQYNAQNG